MKIFFERDYCVSITQKYDGSVNHVVYSMEGCIHCINSATNVLILIDCHVHISFNDSRNPMTINVREIICGVFITITKSWQ